MLDLTLLHVEISVLGIHCLNMSMRDLVIEEVDFFIMFLPV